MTTKIADGISSMVADVVSSIVAEDLCSEVADRRGGAAEAACVAEEMCSPSGILADKTKKETVTAVINDTGSGTKEKTVEWTCEELRAAQEADSEIPPTLEWNEEHDDELQRMKEVQHATTNAARGCGRSDEKTGGPIAAKNTATFER